MKHLPPTRLGSGGWESMVPALVAQSLPRELTLHKQGKQGKCEEEKLGLYTR